MEIKTLCEPGNGDGVSQSPHDPGEVLKRHFLSFYWKKHKGQRKGRSQGLSRWPPGQAVGSSSEGWEAAAVGSGETSTGPCTTRAHTPLVLFFRLPLMWGLQGQRKGRSTAARIASLVKSVLSGNSQEKREGR